MDKLPITIQILKMENESLDALLESILPLNGYIEIVHAFDSCDRSKLLNNAIQRAKTDWQLYLTSSEILLNGHKAIKEALSSNNNFFLQIMQENIIVKQVRLWKKSSNCIFKNPIYEELQDEKAKFLDAVIWRKVSKPYTEKDFETWGNNKLDSDYYYYKAFTCLFNKDYKNFLNLGNYYLFSSSDKIKSTILRYGLASYSNDSFENAAICLSQNVLMAEFWCLTGDIHLKNKQFEKAIACYENAIILGKYRKKNDLWPISISKYKEYPEKKIEECNEMIRNSIKFKRYGQAHSLSP